MNARANRPALLVLLAALVVAGCASIPAQQTTEPDAGAVATAVAATVQAAQALTVAAPTASPTAAPPTPTATLPLPTATQAPTQTPAPSATPAPTLTPTATPIPCDWARLVSDLDVPDNTVYSPGATFFKSWRLQNIGSCTWTGDYDLVFARGDRLEGPLSVPLPRNVAPGETVDISIRLEAGARSGTYQGYWVLRNAAGGLFGLGTTVDNPFWVKIVVREPDRVVFDLVESACDARWRTSSETNLPCGQNKTNAPGSVYVLETPKLENGVTDNEPALITIPEAGGNGVIVGRFPPFRVQSGDRFRAVVGCLFDAAGCKVTFELRYRTPKQDAQTLGAWTESLDGKFTRLDVPLSDLAGESVEIILKVIAVDEATDNHAFWLFPHVVR